jgi:hypothetical protein
LIVVTADWLAPRRNGHSDDDAEQAAIRRRAVDAIGSVAGGDPTRSERASELVREITYRKPVKESNARAASAVGLIDTGAILALIDRSHKWHASCVKGLRQ